MGLDSSSKTHYNLFLFFQWWKRVGYSNFSTSDCCFLVTRLSWTHCLLSWRAASMVFSENFQQEQGINSFLKMLKSFKTERVVCFFLYSPTNPIKNPNNGILMLLTRAVCGASMLSRTSQKHFKMSPFCPVWVTFAQICSAEPFQETAGFDFWPIRLFSWNVWPHSGALDDVKISFNASVTRSTVTAAITQLYSAHHWNYSFR